MVARPGLRRAQGVPAAVAQRADPPPAPAGRPGRTARAASRTATRCSRPAWRSTTSRGPPSTPTRCSVAHKVGSGLLMSNQAAYVEYQPLGVVGVIGPWNYPVFTPIGSIAYALAAGNTVVFKPSEYTPGVGQLARRHVHRGRPRAPGAEPRHGPGRDRQRTCAPPTSTRSRSPARRPTGKKVMAACAENLTPVVIEAGGKDSLIVDEDADLQGSGRGRAVGGHVERGPDLHRHRARLRARAGLRPVHGRAAQAGGRRRVRATTTAASTGPPRCPSSSTSSAATSRTRSPRAARRCSAASDSVGDRYVQPTILTHVPEDSLAVTEETFGPDARGQPGQGHGRGRRADQRHEVRPGRRGVRQEARDGHRVADPLGHDLGQLGDLVRRDPRRCRSAGSATRASGASTAPTACASSPTRRRSRASG